MHFRFDIYNCTDESEGIGQWHNKYIGDEAKA